MTYSYTYRAANGALAIETIAADSRSAALALIWAQGRSVVNLEVVRGGKSVTRPLRVRVSMFLLALILALIGLYSWLSNEEKTDKTDLLQQRIKKKRPTSDTTNRPSSRHSPPVAKETAEVVQRPLVQPRTPTNEVKAIKPGFFHPTKTLEDGTVVDLRPPPMLKDPMERALVAVATPGGMAIPFAAAMRRFSKEQILEMINRPVEFLPDDSEALRLRKTTLQQVKDVFKEYLASGKDVSEAIYEVDRQMRRESAKQAVAYRGLATVMSKGDAKSVNDYVKMVNKELAEEGLRPLSVPPQFKQQISQEGDAP